MVSYRGTALILLLVLAKPALAAVSIHEIAWMGSQTSANHEWTELYNSGQTEVVVDNWTLSDGVNLNIDLLGTISAGEYAVLERTSEDSAPGTAFLIYVGALVNTGATLVLKDGNGAIVDQVVGGENWVNIGGDNVTKDTAQYSNQGWLTGLPTPGAINVTVSSAGSENSNDDNSETSSSSNKNETRSSSGNKSSAQSVRLENLETKLAIAPSVQSIGYVNQTIPFTVSASGMNLDPLIRYEWNFGDSYTASGRKVEHFYQHPGNYVATVIARYKNQEQVARQEITILPVTFTLGYNDAGDIQIHNNSQYDVDISGYTLKGTESLVLPPRSIILPRATITIDNDRVGATRNTLLAFYDPKMNLVASTYQGLAMDETDLYKFKEEPAATPILNLQNIESSPPSSTLFNFKNETSLDSSEDILVEADNGANDLETEVATTESESRWPYLALIGLILASVGGIYFGQRQRATLYFQGERKL